MSEFENDQETALSLMNVEFMPYLAEEQLKNATYQKYPLQDLLTLGVGVKPMVDVIKNFTSQGAAGTSGLYYVDTKGSQMFQFNNGSGFLGSLKAADGGVGGGQAVLTEAKIPLDPTMIFMSAALMNIEKQLGDIQQLQQEMMDFLKAKEKAKLRGDINTLIDILNNYKFNWENETYKTNKHILVQDIRRTAEQSIQFSRDRLRSSLEKKDIIPSNQKVKSKFNEIEDVLKDYQMALYQYAFASYLEIMLLSNFAADYLDGVINRIEELALQYRELYTACYNQLENMSEVSMQSLLATGVAGISKGAGEAISKIPVIKRGPVDEALIASSEKINEMKSNKTEKQMNRLIELAGNGTATFKDKIVEVKKLYNEPKEIYFDHDNLYLVSAA